MKLKQARKHYSAEEKVALLRRHLEKGEPVSKLCEEQTLRPTVFYRWKKEFFEGGAAAFDRGSSSQTIQLQQQVREMELEIQRKNGVIAEVMEELMRCKKKPGGH
jgi:transposase-like protein